MTQYTDFFGTPVNVGDEIVYPVASYTSRAAFARVRIEKIIPLVPHRSNPSYLMREDQKGQQSPSQYGMAEPDKRFVVRVLRERWGYGPNGYEKRMGKHTIRFCENIIRVPDGA